MAHTNADQRNVQIRAKRASVNSTGGFLPPKEQNNTTSVLHDAEGLKEAALKASNGGKKRIVGLYLPDGNRIVLEDKVKDKKGREKEEQRKKKSAEKAGELNIAGDANRRKTNLSEAGHTYNIARQTRQQRAAKEKRSEEDIEDEEAARKAKAILAKDGKSGLQDQAAYRDLFRFFDVDQDGNWGSIEFAQRMTDIGFHNGVEDAANLLYFAGVRDVDRITYNDFLAMMPKLKAFRRVIEKDAMRGFSEKDDGSGYISLKDLRQVIYDLAGPEGCDKGFVESIVKKSDRERTGRIPYDYFIRALFGSAPVIPYKRDMKGATLQQKIISIFGKWCGTTQKDMPPVADETEDDEDTRA